MKYPFLVILTFLSFIQSYGVDVYPVTVESALTLSGELTPFRGVESITLPTNGELISNYYFTNEEIFDNGKFRRIHHGPGEGYPFNLSQFWYQNHAPNTFTLDIVQADPGARWRMINSAANGNVYTMGWVNLSEGMNYLTLNATEHTRAIIGFETQGTFKFRSFSHQFSAQDAAWAIETISVAVPEPSTYSLVAGLLILILISFKGRLIRN